MFKVTATFFKKTIFNSGGVALIFVFCAVVLLSTASNAVTAVQTKNLFKDVDAVTLLGLAATVIGTYLALVSQQEGRSDKRYEEFKSIVSQDVLKLRREFSEEGKNLNAIHDEFEVRFWEELEIVQKDSKDRLAEIEEKLRIQDHILRSTEVAIASHLNSFGHEATIKLLIETHDEISKLRAEIASISTMNLIAARIEILEKNTVTQ